jgi:aldose 1-epimerase
VKIVDVVDHRIAVPMDRGTVVNGGHATVADVAARPFSGEQIEIRHRNHQATIVEAGAGLRRYRVGEREIIDGYGLHELPPAAHGQVLMPWPNRVRDGCYEFAGEARQLPLTEPKKGNALHGLVRWANWQVAERGDARVRMEHILHPQEGFPFTLALAVEYELDDGGLRVEMTGENIGGGPCPFGAGAHPYVTLGTPTIDGCVVRAPGRSWMPTDEQMIPIGTEPVDGTEYDFRRGRAIGTTQLDTAFANLERDENGVARVELVGGDDDAVTFWLDSNFRYLMLFTGDTIGEPERRRRALGIEPMSCAPNAFQTGDGLIVLDPGESFRGSWGITPS